MPDFTVAGLLLLALIIVLVLIFFSFVPGACGSQCRLTGSAWAKMITLVGMRLRRVPPARSSPPDQAVKAGPDTSASTGGGPLPGRRQRARSSTP